MKITITMPEYVYRKLEEDRGMIPRSTWIQKLITTSVKANKDMEKMWGKSVVDVIEDEEELSTVEEKSEKEFKSYFK